MYTYNDHMQPDIIGKVVNIFLKILPNLIPNKLTHTSVIQLGFFLNIFSIYL